MWDLIKDFCIYLLRRDSQSAMCLMIDVSNRLNDKDLQDFKDYCESLQWFRRTP